MSVFSEKIDLNNNRYPNMRKLKFVLLLVVIFLCRPGYSQRYEQKPPDKTRILFLLDGSGSMLGQWNNGQLKIDVARSILTDLVDSLKENTNLELALRVYGHQYGRQLQVCTDSKLEIGFRANNHQDITLKLKTIQPKGTTPIAYSLEQAANDFPADKNVRNVIIIITDGIESCDGDPCAVSQALQKKNIFLKPFVIGLGLNESYTDAFACMGTFFDVTDIDELRGSLDEALKQTLDKTTVSVQLLDHNNQPTVSNLNVSFINRITNQPVYDFVHYRDQAGRPDTVEIDAVLDYDLAVYSVPPVTHKNIKIKGGVHNVIPVKVPIGTLSFKMDGLSEYGNTPIPVIVRPTGHREILNKQDFRQKYQYLVGNYDLEIFTMPKTIVRNYPLKPGQDNTITLPKPGVINVNLGARGFGSLYRMEEDKQEWIYNIPYETTQWTTAIQPGVYKIVYRADFAKGSKYTKVKTFTVTSGSTQSINLNR